MKYTAAAILPVFLAAAVCDQHFKSPTPEDNAEAYRGSYGIPHSGIRRVSDQDIGNASESTAADILGGSRVQHGKYPFFARLVNRGFYSTHCGGALISQLYVLTAAHCIEQKDPQELAVRLGSVEINHREREYAVRASFIHWKRYRNGLDIGLLRLRQRVQFSVNIQPIALPTAGQQYVGTKAVLMGFGQVDNAGQSSPYLLEMEVTVDSTKTCRKHYGESISQTHICATDRSVHLGRGGCHGDSGSPLVAKKDGKFVLLGVISFGKFPCGQQGVPAVCARVTEALQFIRSAVSQL